MRNLDMVFPQVSTQRNSLVWWLVPDGDLSAHRLAAERKKNIRQKTMMWASLSLAIVLAVHWGIHMRTRHVVMLAVSVLSIPAVSMPAQKARALEPEKYTVYCAEDRIEVSFWDLEQMKVRRGSNVCQFQSYTSYSSALNFAQKNFGGEGADCSC